MTAALGLSGTRDLRARRALAAMLSSRDAPTNDALQAAALWALGATGDAMAIPRLRAALSASTLVRTAAVARLGEAPAQTAPVDAIARMMFSPLSASLRRAAARALTHLAQPIPGTSPQESIEPALNAPGTSMLHAWIDPPDEPIDGARALVRFTPQIARAAVDAVGYREGLTTVLDALAVPGTLAPMVSFAADPGEVVPAIQTVVAAITPGLVRAQTLPDPTVRARALTLLARTPSSESDAVLVGALSDPSATVAEAAVSALQSRGVVYPPGAVHALLVRLADTATRWTSRTQAADALATLGDATASQGLAEALRADPYAYVRAAAARALGRIGARDPEAVAALSGSATGDPDATVREAARAALRVR